MLIGRSGWQVYALRLCQIACRPNQRSLWTSPLLALIHTLFLVSEPGALQGEKPRRKKNIHTNRTGLCLRTSADCKRSSGTGRRFCRRRVFSQLNKRCFFKDDRNKWNHYFHCIDAVFAAVSRIFQVACIASVSETGEFYCALGGHRTFLRCFARGVNRAS